MRMPKLTLAAAALAALLAAAPAVAVAADALGTDDGTELTLWTRAAIEGCRVSAAPSLARVVIGVDPPGSARQGSDACGIVAAGITGDGIVYVLEDASAAGLQPAGWASRAVALYRRLEADAIVAEVNMGGDMVSAVLKQVDATVPVKTVHATRGKWLRAEPIARCMHKAR